MTVSSRTTVDRDWPTVSPGISSSPQFLSTPEPLSQATGPNIDGLRLGGKSTSATTWPMGSEGKESLLCHFLGCYGGKVPGLPHEALKCLPPHIHESVWWPAPRGTSSTVGVKQALWLENPAIPSPVILGHVCVCDSHSHCRNEDWGPPVGFLDIVSRGCTCPIPTAFNAAATTGG